jgi:hypothetical protein
MTFESIFLSNQIFNLPTSNQVTYRFENKTINVDVRLISNFNMFVKKKTHIV